MKNELGVDPKVYELAEYFLPGAERQKVEELAQAIQDAVELEIA